MDKLRKLLPLMDAPENFFLVVGGVFAIAFALLTPPLQIVDEHAHFYRIAQLGKGHIIAPHIATRDGVKRFGDRLPKELIDQTDALVLGADKATGKYNTSLIGKYLFAPIKNPKPEIIGFEGSALYTPIVYAPQVVTYKGLAVITKAPLARMYAARVANALTWLVLLYLAIRLIPFGKWTLVVFSLMPVNVFIAGSLSADTVVVALCFLFVAYALKLATTKQKITTRQLLLLGLLMSSVALAKSAYYPLLLMALLIPGKYLERPKLMRAALLGVPLLLSAAWSYAVRPIGTSLHRAFDPYVHFAPSDQITHAMSHPFSPVYSVSNSIVSGVSDITIRDLFGTFTWARIILPLWLQMLSLLVLVLALCYQLGRTRRVRLPAFFRTVPLAALVGTFVFIYVTFYFIWSPPGADHIGGVQGRYFLPLLPLLIPIFTSKKTFINLSETAFRRAIQGGTLGLLTVTLLMVAHHFF